MGKALGTPVRVVEYDMGTEFNKSIKDLQDTVYEVRDGKEHKIKVFQRVTNAGVEQTNAKMQRIFYTLVAQKRTNFAGTVKQAVDISNNTKNRKPRFEDLGDFWRRPTLKGELKQRTNARAESADSLIISPD